MFRYEGTEIGTSGIKAAERCRAYFLLLLSFSTRFLDCMYLATGILVSSTHVRYLDTRALRLPCEDCLVLGRPPSTKCRKCRQQCVILYGNGSFGPGISLAFNVGHELPVRLQCQVPVMLDYTGWPRHHLALEIPIVFVLVPQDPAGCYTAFAST